MQGGVCVEEAEQVSGVVGEIGEGPAVVSAVGRSGAEGLGSGGEVGRGVTAREASGPQRPRPTSGVR